MSRIGKLPIHVPAGVTVTIKDNVVTVKGPKGELVQEVNPDINVTLEDGVIHLTRPTDDKNHRALHGLYRSLINNMVVGCSWRWMRQGRAGKRRQSDCTATFAAGEEAGRFPAYSFLKD